MDSETVPDLIAEIRAHRAEYRESQRRQDEMTQALRAAVDEIATLVRVLDRDMASVKTEMQTQKRLGERIRQMELRQSWLFGAAAVAGAGLSWLSRKLFGEP